MSSPHAVLRSRLTVLVLRQLTRTTWPFLTRQHLNFAENFYASGRVSGSAYSRVSHSTLSPFGCGGVSLSATRCAKARPA